MVASLAVRRGGGTMAYKPLLAAVPLAVPRQMSTHAARSSRTLRTTTAYNSATFQRVGGTFAARSTLLAGTPFTSPVTSRNFSLWPSRKPDVEQTTADTAHDVTESAQSGVQSLQSEASKALQQGEEATSNAVQHAQEVASDTLSSINHSAHDAATRVSDSLGLVDPAAASTVSEAFGSAMGVREGELAALGLNHWSSPVGWITNVLENVGLYTGLPWWGTIMVTTVLLRLCLAPINIGGQKNAIRLGNIQPELKRHMDDIKQFKAKNDQIELQKAVAETQNLMRRHNTNPIKSITPILFQLPLMFSFYLALARLAASGSDTFAHGGPFWTVDLTTPDPTWFLPAVSTIATLAVAELGFKFGTTAQSDPSQTQLMKWIFRGAMPVIGYFASVLPSGVLVYWATTNVWSLLQLGVLQIPSVRKWAKFPKRIEHAKDPYAPAPKSIIAQIKERAAAKSAPAVKPVIASPKAANSARSDALKELLDEQASYEQSSQSKGKKPASNAAQKKNNRVLEARARKIRR